MNCVLTTEQQRLLFGKVAIDLKNSPTFDFNTYAKGFYDLINTKTNDPILAANYVALLPTNIWAVMGVDRNIRRKLATIGGKLVDLETQFDDFNKVQEFIKGFQNEGGLSSLEKTIQKESLTTLPEPIKVIPTPVQTPQISLWDLNFDVDKANEMRPEMALYTNVKSQLIVNRKDDGTSVVDGKPVKMQIVSTADWQSTDFYPKVEAALLAGDKRMEEFNRKGMVLVVTDLNGNLVRFNTEQKISDTGKPAYYQFRAPKKLPGGVYTFDFNEQAYVDQLKKQRGFTQKQAEELLQKQNEQFQTIRETLLTNPKSRMDVWITGGFTNIVLKPAPQNLTIGNVFDFQGKAFKPYKGPEGKENLYFFDYPGAQGNFVINKPKVPDPIISKLVQMLTDLVVTRNGSAFKTIDKIKLFKQFIHIDPAIFALKESPTGDLEVQKLGRTISYPNKEAMVADLMSVFRNNVLTRELSDSQVAAKQAKGSQIVSDIKGAPYGSIFQYNDNGKVRSFEVGPLQLKIDKTAIDNNKYKDFDIVNKDGIQTITVVDRPYYPFIQSNFLVDKKQIPPQEKEAGQTLEFALAPEVIIDTIKKEDAAKFTTYKGIPLFEGEIVNSTGQKGGAQYDRKNNRITINKTVLREKFEQKAWTKSRVLTDKSEAKPLQEGSFPTYKDWEDFVIEHEYQHSIISQKEGETKGAYEDRINRAAFDYLDVKSEAESQGEQEGLFDENGNLNPKAYEKKTPEKVAGINEVPKEPTLEEWLKNLSKDELFKRTGQENIEATEDQIAQAKVWYKNNPLSNYFPFEAMFSVVNKKGSNNIANWTNSGITLFKGADYSDLYHEAWHGFTQGFLSKDEKTNLYNEAKKLSGSFTDYNGNKVKFNEATDLQIEEYLAEDFREYMLSDGKKVLKTSPVRNSIFRRILNFLKELFGNSSVRQTIIDEKVNKKVSDLYNKLRVGDLTSYTFSAKNRNYDTLNKALQSIAPEETEKSLSFEQSAIIYSAVNSLFSECIDKLNELYPDVKYTTAMLSTPKGIKNLYNYTKTRLEKTLANLISKESLTGDEQNQRDLLEYTLRNFGDIDTLSNNKLDQGVVGYHMFKTDLIHKDTFDDILEEEEMEERQEQGKEYFDRGGNEKSPFELASREVSNILKSLYQTDQNGNVLKDMFGFPRLLNHKAAFSYILRLVENSKDLTEMVARLEANQDKYYPIQQLLRKMGPVYSPNQTARETDLWSKFFQTFNKYRQPLVQTTVNKTEVRDRVTREVIGDVTYDIKIGNALADTNKTDQDWRAQFSKETSNPFIKNEPAKGNYLDSTALLLAYPTLEAVNADPMKFLNDVGIKMYDIPTVKDELESAIKSGSIRLSGIYGNIQKLNEAGIIIRNIGTYLTAYKRLGVPGLVGQTGPNSNYGKLLSIQTKYSSDYSDFMVQNAAGDPQSEYTLNSSLTQIAKQINNAPSYVELVNSAPTAQYNNSKGSPGRPYNPFVNSSIWFKALFDMDEMGGPKRDNELTIDNLSGINSSVNDGVFKEGVVLSQADEVGKLMSDFHTQLMKFTPELTRHAGKKTSLAVYLRNYYTGSKNKRLYIDTESFVSGDSVSSGAEKFQTILKNYLAGELDRINYAKALLADESVTQTDFAYLKRGTKFVAFDGVLSQETKDQLYEVKGDLVDYLNSDAGLQLDNQIRQEILSYFTGLVTGVQTKMNQSGFISPTLIERVRDDAQKDGVSPLFLTDPNITKALSASFVANNWIHHFEEMITFYGDIALYKDFFKRNASLNSTGDIIRNDAEFIKTVNEKIGKGFTEQLGITMEERPYTGQFQTAVVSDVLVQSVYLPQYKKASSSDTIDEKYGINSKGEPGVNEADAQGLIAFDIYRIVLKGLGKWTIPQEQGYQDLLAGKPAEQIEMEEMYPTLKMGMYGPIQSEYLPLTGLHKFALFPLIPGVIRSNLQELHEKMMREGIDYLTFESGSKVATISDKSGMRPLYSDVKNRVLNTEPFVKNTVFSEYLKYQVESAPFYKGKITLATQLRKLADIGLTNEGVPTDYVADARFKDRESAWESMTETQKKSASKNYTLRANYLSALRGLVEAQKNKLLSDIGWKENKDGSISGDMSSLLKLISDELKRGDVGDHEWAYIQTINKDNVAHALDISTSADMIEKVVVSLINKRLVNLKVTGEQLVLVSGTGFEDKAFAYQSDRNFEAPTKEDLEKYGTNDLPGYYIGDNGLIQAAKVKIALQGEFKKLLKHPDVKKKAAILNISDFQALNLLIKDQEWVQEGDNRYLISMVGARIPTQGINSAEFVEVYEFLPEIAGNIIIAPSEITSKGGSDFDYDKLPLMMPSFSVDGDKVTLSKNSKGGGNIPGIQNDLIKSLISILEQAGNFEALITPNDTNLVKPLADSIYEEENGKDAKSKDKQGTRMFEPLHNIKVQQANSIGKDTLGIGAIYNTFNAVFNSIGLTLNPQYGSKKNPKRAVLKFPHNSKNGNISLSALKDAEDKNSISEVVSQLINGWVDVEKDDWISYIQGNKEIAPVMLFMLRAGVPIENVVYFVTQPVIKEYVAAQRAAKSSFAEPLGYTASQAKMPKVTARNQVLRQFGFDGASLADLIYATEIFVTDDFTIERLKNRDKPGLALSNGTEKVLSGFSDINTDDRTKLTRDEIIEIFAKAGSDKEVKLIYKKLQVKYHPDKKGGDLETSKLINDVYDTGKERGFGNLSAGKPKKEGVDEAYKKQWEFDFAVFLHFLEIENMSKEVDAVQRGFNVDTTRLLTLNDFYTKINEIEELDDNSLIPKKFMDRLKENTPIGPFYVQKFALDIFSKLLPIRSNERLNEYMLNLENAVITLFKDEEAAQKTFKDDLLSYIFQNTVRSYTPPTDISEINFSPMDDRFTNQNEYLHFVDERQKLVSQYSLDQVQDDIDYEEIFVTVQKDPLSEGKEIDELKKAAYESWLDEKALYNIMNPHQIFKSRFGMVGKYSFIVNKYPQLRDRFSLLNNIKSSFKADVQAVDFDLYQEGAKVSNIYNLQLSTMKLSKDEIDIFHENFKDLSNSDNLLSVKDITQKDADYIADFFSKLPLYLYMQTGPNTRNPLSFNRVMPNDKILRILEQPIKDLNLTDEYLDKYLKAFVNANSRISTRSRFKDYLMPDVSQPVKEDVPVNTDQEEKPTDMKQMELFGTEEREIVPSTVNTMLAITNHSGGALGADTEWDIIGKEFGMTDNRHYWMNNKTPNGNTEITEEDKKEGQKKVTEAARQMGRIDPTHQVRDERLIRNWSQVKYADAVFAVTTLLKEGDEMNYGKKAKIVQGKGGTGYAVQMAINEGKPVYLFDQVRNQWFSNIGGVWSKSEVPTLTRNFAGIGTREINEAGKAAIKAVYEKTASSFKPQETPFTYTTEEIENLMNNCKPTK